MSAELRHISYREKEGKGSWTQTEVVVACGCGDFPLSLAGTCCFFPSYKWSEGSLVPDVKER